MKALLQGEPTAVLRHARKLLCGGFLVLLISGSTDALGIITGAFALGLGASGAVFSHWKSERGLWMLAGLFFLMNAVTYTFVVVGQVRDALRGVQVERVILAVDFAIGTLLLSVTLRFLINIAKKNFVLSMRRTKRESRMVSEYEK